jgi:type II secretory pathway component GspD/PulD (secretin)
MIKPIKGSLRVFLLACLLGTLTMHSASGQTGDKQVKILRTNNKAQTNKYVAKVYEFKTNNPYNVRRFLQRPLAAEEGALFTYVNPDYKSGMVLMICPEHQLDYFDKLMPTLDMPGQGTADGSIRDFIKFKHRSVADSDFISAVTTQMTTDSWLYTDSELNGVYISDAPSGYNGVQAFLAAEGGVPRDQVDVSVSIYELELNNDQKIGLDYISWKNGPGQDLFSFGVFGEAERAHNLGFELNGVDSGNTPLFDSGVGIAGLPGKRFHNSGYYGSYLVDVPSQYFDYLAVNGKATIVTQSRLSIMDGDSGSLHTGDKMVYYEVTSDGESRTVDPKLLETGICLDLSPIVGANTINFDVNFSATSLSGFDGAGLPLTASTSYCSNMRVLDGSEIILAGLTRKVDATSSAKIPLLGDIPILGKLFGGDTNVKQDTMVAVVLKPTVIKNAGSNQTSADKMVIADAK